MAGLVWPLKDTDKRFTGYPPELRVPATLFPLRYTAGIVVGFFAVLFGEPGKVNVGHEFSFYGINGLPQHFSECVEVFFVEKQLMLLAGEATALRVPPTLGTGQKIVVGAGGSYVEKIRPFTRFNLV